MRSVARLRVVDDPGHDPLHVADSMIERLGLSSVAGVLTSRLSGGERRRLSIGVELLRAPTICVIDEPTSGLDPTHASSLMVMLAEFAASGTTLVMSTHRAADLRRCDRVVALAPTGTVMFDGTVADAAELIGTDDVDRLHRVLTNGHWNPPDDADPQRGPDERTSGASSTPVTDDVTAAHARAARTRSSSVRVHQQVLELARRSIMIMRHAPITLAVMVGSPVAVISMFTLMFRPGAFVPGAPGSSTAVMTTFWTAFGSFFFGLTYGLLQITPEVAWMRRDWRSGVGAAVQVVVKFIVLLPVLVVVNAGMLGILRLLDRIPPLDTTTAARVVLILTLDAAAGLALGLATSAAVRTTAQAAIALPLLCFPAVLFSGAMVPIGVMPRPGELISAVWPDRWAFESLGANLGVRQLITDPARAAEFGDTWTVGDATVSTILVAMTVGLLVAATVILERRLRAPAK